MKKTKVILVRTKTVKFSMNRLQTDKKQKSDDIVVVRQSFSSNEQAQNNLQDRLNVKNRFFKK